MRQLTALLIALALPAVGADARWEKLKSLRPGERVWIEYTQGKEIKSEKAEWAAWQEESLAVRIRKADVVLSKNDVRRVAAYGGKSHAKGAGYGALLGGGIGAGVYGLAAAGCRDCEISRAAIVGIGSLLAAGVGTAIGAAVGVTNHTTMYDVRKPETDRAVASTVQVSVPQPAQP